MRGMPSFLTGKFRPEGTNEYLEFFKAWAGTSFAYAVFISAGFIFDTNFLNNLLIAGLTGGLGLVLHELAHRVAARRYGSPAVFQSNDGALVISMLAAFAGFFFVAPGAVWHRPLSVEKTGVIAVVGPLSNLVLAALFYLLFLGLRGNTSSLLVLNTAWVGYHLNAFVGLFNMIPVAPLDGSKVWAWNKGVFWVTVVVAAVMSFAL